MFLRKTLLYFTILSMVFTNTFTTIFAEPESSAEVTVETSTSVDVSAENNIYNPGGGELNINAEACILADAHTGIILYEKNAHERLYPASITKVMTTLLACENGNLEDTVTHSHNAVFGIGYGSSHIGMDEGEKLKFEDALYGILLESANEVCMAIAEHIDGTVEKFVDRMNARAQELGCKDTHFANPHGFHDDNHYTTCYDMMLITKEAVKNEEFLKVFSTVEHDIPPTNMNPDVYVLHNKDKMMRPTSPYYYENIIGGKTGFHDQALNTLVTYAGKDDIKLITVVMKDNGAALTYSDTKALMEYGFSLYEEKPLLTEYNKTVPVNQTYKDTTYELGNASLGLSQPFSAKVPKFIDTTKLSTRANVEAVLQAPVEVGKEEGSLDIYYENNIIGSATLVAATGVDAIPQNELEHRERIANLKALIIKTFKITGIIIVVMALLIFSIRIYFRIKNKRNRRRRQVYSYNTRRRSAIPKRVKPKPLNKPKNKKRKVKYKIRFK